MCRSLQAAAIVWFWNVPPKVCALKAQSSVHGAIEKRDMDPSRGGTYWEEVSSLGYALEEDCETQK